MIPVSFRGFRRRPAARPDRHRRAAAARQRVGRGGRKGYPFDLHLVGPRIPPAARSACAWPGSSRCRSGCRQSSWLVVPGASQSREAYAGDRARQLVAWLARVGPQAAWRMTVCSRALLAGRAGWLEGRACTTHHDLIERLRQANPAARVLDNRIYRGRPRGGDQRRHHRRHRPRLVGDRRGARAARRPGGGPRDGGLRPASRRRSAAFPVARPPRPPAPGGPQGAGRARRGAGRGLAAAPHGRPRPRRRAAPRPALRRARGNQPAALPAAAARWRSPSSCWATSPARSRGRRRGRLRLRPPPAPGLAAREGRQPAPALRPDPRPAQV